MGLSNYTPSSRISQSGVCTSSTRPATPYEGQVIYETDTDRVLYFNGSAWVAQNAEINGLTEIGENIADLDTIPIYDVSNTANRKSFMSRVATYIFGKVGGAGTISSTGTMSLTQATYTAPSYVSGWQNYGSPYGPVGYAKLSNGLVTLEGLCQRISGSSGVIFYLPSGFRPQIRHLSMAIGSGGIARIDISEVDGSVNVVQINVSGSVVLSDWISLSGIQFVAA